MTGLAAARLVLLVTSPRVAAGLLSADAWSALGAGPVLGREAEAPHVAAIRAAGVDVRLLPSDAPANVAARELREAGAATGTATWLVAAGGDEAVAHAVSDAAGAAAVEVLHGSWDLPGARLLDVVATMDRLRSPGGCPWDAAQDHASLAPYLVEEAYEAVAAIEDGDLEHLRDELGDVLLQVAFHARLAEELPADERWSVDDVAGGLVDKLVRRHPHVFAGLEVADADEVNRNWETIKASERAGAAPFAGVPMNLPALTLAQKLQRKAGGVDAEPLGPAAHHFDSNVTAEAAGELLWQVVAACRAAGIDAEAALRAKARQFRGATPSGDEDANPSP